MNSHPRTIIGFSLLALLLAMAPAACIAAEPSVDVLWPAGAPGAKGAADGDVPKLTIYLPEKDKATGAAIVICPGGGYGHLAMDHEGHQIAQWLNSFGVAGFILQYRHRNSGAGYGHPAPLQDVQRAMGIARSRAGEWGIDPGRIGVLGFSAGGHLSAALSTNFERRLYEPVDEADRTSCRPDFTVLVYPAYLTVEKEGDHRVAPELPITSATPPAFLVQAWDDPVPAEGALFYSLALKRAKVPVELHLYPAGGHGYGLRPAATAVTRWPMRAEEWLRTMGFLGAAKEAGK